MLLTAKCIEYRENLINSRRERLYSIAATEDIVVLRSVGRYISACLLDGLINSAVVVNESKRGMRNYSTL